MRPWDFTNSCTRCLWPSALWRWGDWGSGRLRALKKPLILLHLQDSAWFQLGCDSGSGVQLLPRSWVGKIPWRRKWQPTPGFLPGEFLGQRSLAGCSPWGHKESDTTEHARAHTRCDTCIFTYWYLAVIFQIGSGSRDFHSLAFSPLLLVLWAGRHLSNFSWRSTQVKWLWSWKSLIFLFFF